MNNLEIITIFDVLNNSEPELVNIKSAYWISMNIKLITPYILAFNKLRDSLLSTLEYKEYENEIKSSVDECSKKEINEKYSNMLNNHDTIMNKYLSKKVNPPAWYKISINDIAGIKPGDIPKLLELII
ncbi:MAG: hypothetical protein M0R17_00020 [Candidatus Omnitrophica bacterium]|jgi:Mg2+/Co2+ transporter CorB|nr:hypothetical protein [Candidatus Omnitrophota bacterium]